MQFKTRHNHWIVEKLTSIYTYSLHLMETDNKGVTVRIMMLMHLIKQQNEKTATLTNFVDS